MNLKSELAITASAGGMIGEETMAQWAELLERHGGSHVRLAIARVRAAKRARQVAVDDVAKDLKHALTAKAGAASPTDEALAQPAGIIVDAAAPEPVEHEPTPAPPRQPATEKRPRARSRSPEHARDPGETLTIAEGVLERTFVGDLAGDLAPLIEQLITAYADHHQVEILPRPRRALCRAVAAVFPSEA